MKAIAGVLLVLVGCAGAPVYRAAPNAIGPYSASVEAHGLVFLSGQIGKDKSSIGKEVGAVLDNVEAQLAAAGLTIADVVASTVYLTEMQDFAAMNEVYGARFHKPYPARTTVAVKELPAGAHVEIAVIAARR